MIINFTSQRHLLAQYSQMMFRRSAKGNSCCRLKDFDVTRHFDAIWIQEIHGFICLLLCFTRSLLQISFWDRCAVKSVPKVSLWHNMSPGRRHYRWGKLKKYGKSGLQSFWLNLCSSFKNRFQPCPEADGLVVCRWFKWIPTRTYAICHNMSIYDMIYDIWI